MADEESPALIEQRFALLERCMTAGELEAWQAAWREEEEDEGACGSGADGEWTMEQGAEARSGSSKKKKTKKGSNTRKRSRNPRTARRVRREKELRERQQAAAEATLCFGEGKPFFFVSLHFSLPCMPCGAVSASPLPILIS